MKYRGFIAFLVSAFLIGPAFLFPETWASAVLGVLGSLALNFAVRDNQRVCAHFFLFGLILGVVGFYWLPETLEFFGGFPVYISYLLFAAFCVVGALQFVLCGLLYKALARRPLLNSASLALPLAWMTAEFLVPRLFPWYLAHTQIVWTSFSGLAEFFGIAPLSFLLLWWTGGLLNFVQMGARPRSFLHRTVLCPLTALLLLLLLGYAREQRVQALMESLPSVKLGLIQGNLEAKQKGNVRYFDTNLQRYRELSVEASAKGADILFWPESVFIRWTPEEIENVSGTPVHPFPQISKPLVYGLLSYRNRVGGRVLTRDEDFQKFNSAFAIDPDGKVLGRYHKRVLMPMGEYMPFADIFPWLKDFSPQTGDFSKGDLNTPLAIPYDRGLASIAALICYEDLIPSLAREAVSGGAQVLVNITNDAWYGRTHAPYQHHLLAAWRSIETGRFLVRVTNTGYTAVVDPLGKTIAGLPIFSEGTLLVNVNLIDRQTLYAKVGDIFSWVLVGLVFLLAAESFISGKLSK